MDLHEHLVILKAMLDAERAMRDHADALHRATQKLASEWDAFDAFPELANFRAKLDLDLPGAGPELP